MASLQGIIAAILRAFGGSRSGRASEAWDSDTDTDSPGSGISIFGVTIGDGDSPVERSVGDSIRGEAGDGDAAEGGDGGDGSDNGE